MSVGRLDFDSEGLLLLTNDGSLARQLELPQTGWIRRYRARMFGVPEDRDLLALKRGLVVDGVGTVLLTQLWITAKVLTLG